jgi:O-antigen/teichoic acid export membrane protein
MFGFSIPPVRGSTSNKALEVLSIAPNPASLTALRNSDTRQTKPGRDRGCAALLSRMSESGIGRQSIVLFFAQLSNAALGMAVYVILTRSLSVDDFGTYTFAISFLTFTGVFFDFGLSSSGMRLMALAESDREKRARMGTITVFSLLIGAAFCVFAAAASFAVRPVFSDGTARVILAVAPLALAIPLQETVISLCQGANKIGFLSVFYVLPRLIVLLLLAVLPLVWVLSATMAAVATLAAAAIAVTAAMLYFRPTLEAFRAQALLLKREIGEFGKQVYAGRIVDGLTNGADRMLISYFSGMPTLGFYSIAMTMTSPLGMFSRSISSSSYRSFARADRIPGQVLLANGVWCVAGSLILVAACSVLIPLFFTDKYSTAMQVLPYLAAGSALAGLNMPFHTFLSARRRGRAIKIMSITTSAVNVLLNIALVPVFSMRGAGIAMISSYGLNIGMNLFFYRQYLRETTAATITD